MIKLKQQDVDRFIQTLENSITRQIISLRVLPLHGRAFEQNSVLEAIDFVANYSATAVDTPVLKFEIEISYCNGDKIQAIISDKNNVLTFLNNYLPVTPP
ncbi:hypothetical protein ACE1B6_15510 [Aerosakkonemataceae cyanobacterium BLCC-F154]|uniref:Uncharacterized protein n=1 Tax=Floridaenema fluviatile BLCC-F154 TaxID=3153640 RepID=A0ABV4YEX4_9CYAN